MSGELRHESDERTIRFGIEGLIDRTDLIGKMERALEDDHIVFLSSESGLGKRSCVSILLSRTAFALCPTLTFELADKQPEDIISELDGLSTSPLCRVSLSKFDPRPIVSLQGLPALDEDEVEAVVHQFRRIIRRGCDIVVTMEPEGETILDGMHNAVCLKTGDLLVTRAELMLWRPDLSRRQIDRIILMSHGMASLVAASGRGKGKGLSDSPTMREVSHVLLKDAFRPSLLESERLLRLIMLAMDRGSFEELAFVGIRTLDEMLECMAVESPLFGIDLTSRHFRVAPLDEDVVRRTISVMSRGSRDLMRSCVDLLMQRGDHARGYMVATCCLSKEHMERVVRDWPMELLDCGGAPMMREAVEQRASEPIDTWPLGLVVARLATAMLNDELVFDEEAYAIVSRPHEGRDEVMALQVLLFVHSRLSAGSSGRTCELTGTDDAREARVQLLTRVGGCDDHMVRGLSIHLGTVSLLLDGDLEDAEERLASAWVNPQVSSVVDAILTADRVLVHGLLGRQLSIPEQHGLATTHVLLKGWGSSGLQLMLECCEGIAAALEGKGANWHDLARASQRLSKRGDDALRALLLLCEAIHAASNHDRVSVHVRTANIVRLGEACGCELISTSGRFLEQAARSEGLTVDQAMKGLSAVCLSQGRTLNDVEMDMAQAFTTNVFSAALNLCGLPIGKDSGFDEPWASWVASLRRQSLQKRIAAGKKNVEVREKVTPDTEKPGPKTRLRVCGMGMLTVYKDGSRMSDSIWRRNASRTLLQLLIAAKGHCLTNARAMSLLWPDVDYVLARSRLYTAVSGLRASLADGEEVSFVSRMEGSVSLDGSMASYDVDEIEALSHRIISNNGNNDWLIEQCHKLGDLYKGDLTCPNYDPTGLFERRTSELAALCADAMVVGCEAALEEGRVREALWLARTAHARRPLGEDAESMLLRSLVAAGLSVEAHDSYEEFARQTILHEGKPPTRIIRELARGLLLIDRDVPEGESVMPSITSSEVISPRSNSAGDDGLHRPQAS